MAMLAYGPPPATKTEQKRVIVLSKELYECAVWDDEVQQQSENMYWGKEESASDTEERTEQYLDEKEGQVSIAEERMFPPDNKLSQEQPGNEFDIDPTLPEQQREAMIELLNNNSDVFATTLEALEECTVAKHEIITSHEYPIKQRPYRPGSAKEQFIKEEIERMLAAGLIRSSRSPWASPVVVVAKKNGKMRLCVDYRALNKITKKDAFQLPRIDAIFDALSGGLYYSTVDAAAGFWQIAMDKESIEKTAFTTMWGIFEFLVMPFGLTNAPATYQRTMDIVLQDLLWTKAVNFIDDTCVFSKNSFKEHLEHLQETFQRLREAKLKLNPEKCHFGYRQVKLLGHVISREGLQTDPEKVKQVQEMRPPRTITEVRAFLGLAGYYRRYIKNFSARAKPLTELLQKETPWLWDERRQSAFQDLKDQLMSAEVMMLPDLEKPFILTTDASYQGLGAVLSQLDKEGKERVIAYSSSGLSPAQKNYSTTHIEALAVVWAIGKFSHYLGNHFTLRTDHSALKTILGGTKPLAGRLARWALSLQEYKYTVEHKPGLNNPADALSRIISKVEVIRDNLVPIRNYLEGRGVVGSKTNQRKIKHQAKLFKLSNNNLLRKKKKTWIKVLEESTDRTEAMQELHQGNGHLGLRKTFNLISERFWWPGLHSDLQKYLEQCDECNRQARPSHVEISRPLLVENVFDRWQIDLIGPLTPTRRRNTYICVAIESVTRWTEAAPLKKATAQEVADFIMHYIISRHGCPAHLQSDNGSHFKNETIKLLAEKWNIQHHFSTPYHPQSNGMVERMNQTLAKSLAKTCQGKDWDLNIDQCLLGARTAKHDTTRYSPAELLYGRKLVLPVELKH
jgi:hypothetical protein